MAGFVIRTLVTAGALWVAVAIVPGLAARDMGALLIAAVVLVFMFGMADSAERAWVPALFIGSVVALWVSGQPFSVASAIGFITLAGIATRNGILKISHYINLVMFEGEQFGRRMVIPREKFLALFADPADNSEP